MTTEDTRSQQFSYPLDYLAVGIPSVAGVEEALKRMDEILKGNSEQCDIDLIGDVVARGLAEAPRHTHRRNLSTLTLPGGAQPLGILNRAQALADGEVRTSTHAQSVTTTFEAHDLEWVDVRQFELIKVFHPVYAELDLLTLRIQGICRNCGPVLGWDAELEYVPLVTLPTVATRHHLDIYRRRADPAPAGDSLEVRAGADQTHREDRTT